MKYIIQVLFVIITFNVCYGQEFNTYTIKTEKGKKIIENKAPLWKDKRIELKYYRQIGKLEGDNENYLFNLPICLAIDSKNNLYVGEQGNIRIQKFDKDLNYIKTIGREGQGPNEFEIVGIIIIQRDTLYVMSSFRNISVLTLDGKEIRRIHMPMRIARELYVTKTGLIIANFDIDKLNILRRQNNKEIEVMYPVVKYPAIYDRNGIFLKEFGSEMDFGNDFANYKLNVWNFVYDESDFLYLYFGYHNRIEKFSPDGEFIYRVTWPVGYKISIPKKRGMEQLITRGGGIDHKNRVWILMVNRLLYVREVKPEDMYFAVFDKEGILLCFVPVPRKESFQIIGDSMFFINRDDTYCIYEYKIIEK